MRLTTLLKRPSVRSVLPILAATVASLLAAPDLAVSLTGPTTTSTPPHPSWTVSADSEQSNETPASNAIDGNPTTMWHTQYAPTAAPLPHTLTIDMRATNIVAGLRYQPRTDQPNGRIGSYQIHLSADGTTWDNPVATGTFADNTTEQVVSFAPTTAQYVRLTALSEAGNRGPWSSAAEVNLVLNPVPTLPRVGWTVAADSAQPGEGPAGNAIDGNPNTLWHTQYAPITAPLPHTFTIDMHASNTVSGLRYQPRADHPNGHIGSYQIHLSTDGTNWGNPVATGVFPDDTTEKAVLFTPATARFVRLSALTEAGNRGTFSSAAEIHLTNNPVSAIQCTSNAPVYTTRTTGAFVRYQHLRPENGTNSWAAQQQIASFALDARHLAGPDGVIYAATNNGELRRRRWNGTSWDTFNGAQYEVIDTNPLWARYTTPEYFNRITVDSQGDIYTVETDGWLHWRRYSSVTRSWAHRLVKQSAPNLIVAAGPGVIYTRAGQLLSRFEYHAESQRSRTWGVGTGWDTFSRLFSSGGDLLYAIRADTGDLAWYRYDRDTRTWANGMVDDIPVGVPISTGWQNEYETFAAPDSCQMSGVPWRPMRPQVTPRPNAPVTMTLSRNGHLHYSYVDSEGRAVYAEAADLTGGTPVRLAAVPGMTGLTGPTSTAENDGGRIQIVGSGLDAEIHSNTQAIAGGLWGQVDTLGGFFDAPPRLVRSNAILVAFSVDQNGRTWARMPICANGPLHPWYKLDSSEIRLGNQSPIVVVKTEGSSSNRVAFFGQGSDGTIYTHFDRLITIGDCGPVMSSFLWGIRSWLNLGGSGFVGPPSAVLMPDETVHVFATGSDGVVYTQRQGTDGFPGTWTRVSTGPIASGPASATLAPDGKIKIVVRGADGYIYYTSETAADAATFDPWLAIPDTDESGTDPTALAVPASNTWVVAYRTDLDVPRLRRYVPGAPAAPAAAASTFADVPMTPPAG